MFQSVFFHLVPNERNPLPPSSPLRASVPQPAGMFGLLHCGFRVRCGLWPVHPLVHPVRPLLLPLLVQTRLQGLQVSTRID